VQQRHRRLRAQIDALTPELSGEVASGGDGGGDALVH
jgi:hypothetical protein